MEGRAIARPNCMLIAMGVKKGLALQWRAGQLPGQTAADWGCRFHRNYLQWRAGQLPGQTVGVGAGQINGHIPSMEGRAIARPNRS